MVGGDVFDVYVCGWGWLMLLVADVVDVDDDAGDG
jgi:hypothetical protein